ncbi:hypothetical protein CcarbDRAFT_3167 [Clostridium carboxidivorans P7]|uniref:Uncharacterized protein n=1 Tax=Clostridium carboxidivorans P7 TaxID=536227 RepID=C6PWK0_9CLOT|nr:hypothetical protein [Clostridium carboxidivorans]EET86353.1 hypothetical protein CcarbDRAFT_3167 [Clostridium carboxidivorans P7]EFG88475.1 hypothetical protein CLCAR_1691 [Clostridium carboxidivorans P7]
MYKGFEFPSGMVTVLKLADTIPEGNMVVVFPNRGNIYFSKKYIRV